MPVQREERRRRERNRHSVRAAEEVLRIARGVRGAAARGDQDVLHVVAAEEVAHLLGITALLLDQPRQRLGLLAKLLLEVGAHESTSETASSDARLPPNAAT